VKNLYLEKWEVKEMRRNEREIKDLATMEKIIRGSSICRMGLCDGDRP
jgi:nitroimidazol reductase NimA-like FMN-containing flavoprotein (pyridoxamine 5'-phosphate oxidase superfamily)